MIIVKLKGGLGNQFFQYAFGVYMAEKLDLTLKVDTTWFKSEFKKKAETPRNFDLPEFFHNIATASKADIEAVIGNPFSQKIWYYLAKAGINLNKHYLLERELFNFDLRELRKIKAPYFIEGHWQSYKYLDVFMKVKMRNIDLTVPLYFKDLANDETKVALHVRRGDYLNNNTHPTLTVDYYMTALSKINHLQNPPSTLLVFSDDIEWCRVNLNLNDYFKKVHFITKGSHVDQFKLMTYCSHFIIANSSFSWWASWLAKHPQKQIFCPSNWINLPGFNPKNFFPPQWIVL